MMAVLIEPSGAKVLYYTTRSCGHNWAERFLEVRATVPLEDLKRFSAESDVFEDLRKYAERLRIRRLGAYEVAQYFVSSHIFDANRTAHFQPEINSQANSYFGVLLANCLLWPLENGGMFRANGFEIKIRGAKDLGGEGQLFIHRACLFRLPLSRSEVTSLKRIQLQNLLFWEAVSRVGDELLLPIVPQK